MARSTEHTVWRACGPPGGLPGWVTDHRESVYSGVKRIWAKLQPWAVTSTGQSLPGAYLKTVLLSQSYLFCKSNHYRNKQKKKRRQSNSCPPFNNLETSTCQTRKVTSHSTKAWGAALIKSDLVWQQGRPGQPCSDRLPGIPCHTPAWPRSFMKGLLPGSIHIFSMNMVLTVVFTFLTQSLSLIFFKKKQQFSF